MKKSHTRRNIFLYKTFILFNEPLFWGPILIASLQGLGHMKLSEIYFMESAVLGICVTLNVPCGSLADTIGRKKTLIIGRIFLLLSTIMFAFMTSPFLAWMGNIMWAIGYSFQSGADKALLYETLKEVRLEKKYKKIEGCAVGLRYFTIAFTSLSVGYLSEINMRIPLYMCIPFMIIPLIASCFFKEIIVERNYNVKDQIRTLFLGIKYALRKAEIRWIIAFCALIMGASKIWFFTYNPYFERVGISLKYYGIIFCLLNIVAWASSHYAHRIEEKISERKCILVMILCVGLPILIMGMFPFWPMAYLVISQNVVRGFMTPFVGAFTNRHIQSENIRATVLSVRSSLTDMVSIISLSWFGLMERPFGLLSSLVVLGIVVLVLGKLIYSRYGKLFPKNK
ncbi:MAG: MFS transporter [Candidatus Paceibacterota bacterium]